MITPRKSRVLERLRAGKKVLSFKSNFTCPRVAEMVGLTGFDALWICQEHVPTGSTWNGKYGSFRPFWKWTSQISAKALK